MAPKKTTTDDESNISIRRVYPRFGYLFVETVNSFGQRDEFIFKPANGKYADFTRGLDDLDTDCMAVVPVGDSPLGNNYHSSRDDLELPEPVIRAVLDEGYAIIKNVDAGWQNWGGRPEFSETYADFADATVVAEPTEE